jgi:hypothetical protein
MVEKMRHGNQKLLSYYHEEYNVWRHIMRNMFEILMTAPPEQITRCKIAMVEMAHGHWEAAALTMDDAAYEAEPGEWARDCLEVRDFCMAMDKVKSEGVHAIPTGDDNRMARVIVSTL